MVRGALGGWLVAAGLAGLVGCPTVRADVTSEQVERAIRSGIVFLKSHQGRNGVWSGPEGITGLATLALLTAGEPADSPSVARALSVLSTQDPDQVNSTYATALQTMSLAAASPRAYQRVIAKNVAWLERAQMRSGNFIVPQRRGVLRAFSPTPSGAWSYSMAQALMGDNSNSQYALLGLHAGSEAGVRVHPDVWKAARHYWESCQQQDWGWAYKPMRQASTGSMTCAGISSLVITGLKHFQSAEELVGDKIQHCGEGQFDRSLQGAIDWLGTNFTVRENVNMGQQWRYYYLYGLERAGRLTGLRYFGGHDWYREGAEVLVAEQDKVAGAWAGGTDGGPIVATSFALLFLAKGRAPVLVNKLRHLPANDWNNDPDDVRNLVDLVSRDWGHLLTWQIVEPSTSRVEDLLQAPIVFINGHDAPVFTDAVKLKLREYVEQGGFILAEACCNRAEFDHGFRTLIKEIFPEQGYELHLLPEEHPIWRAKHLLASDIHPLWGIEHGCRTVVVYTPQDLSCYWNQAESQPDNFSVVKAVRVGQNIVDYVTGREMPADKLDSRELARQPNEVAKRGALQIAKLRHAGDWNIAPLAVPHLTAALRDRLKFDVVINHHEILPSDPNLINYPLLYIHGRAALAFSQQDLGALRKHLDPGGGTIFADAACGSPAFDVSFRKFVAELLPDQPLVPIPREDDLYTRRVCYDLNEVEYTKAAGGQRGFPQLEGVKIHGHWVVIYSKYDIGCALEHPQGIDCKGYTHQSALSIAANIVIYATLP
jgi:hypothetical protein